MVSHRTGLILACLASTLLAACGSKTNSGSFDTDSNCGSISRGLCEGTHSENRLDDTEWTGVCVVSQLDIVDGDWTYLRFHEMANCGFTWIRAKGSAANVWATLASRAESEFMVEHKGEAVFTLLYCDEGGNDANDGCL